MDYKYIEQLLERYWEGETTLQEEAILRAFFSQDDVPANLMKYKSLFDCGLQEETLGDDFDARILDSIGAEGTQAPKAKIVTLASRLKPLFKAAAIVAIILTLGNASQVAFQPKDNIQITENDLYEKPTDGVSVAQADTMRADSMKLSELPILK